MSPIMTLATGLAWAAAAVPAALLAIFSAEMLLGLLTSSGGRRAPRDPGGAVPRTTILIPAHDESLGIADTITAMRARLDPAVELLVVADNCTDDTAERSRDAGATVVERTHATQRGKGFALAFGRDVLAARPADTQPAVVIVMDADCLLDPGSAERLARMAVSSDAPVQACNLVRGDVSAPPMVQISTFAFMVKNLLRQRGMTWAGGAAPLTGTGMAMPWRIFRDAPLASAELAEDLGLGVTLTRAGDVPRYARDAQVWSGAAAQQDTLAQRTRWEHGFLATARTQAVPLILSGIRRRSLAELLLGLHLLVPPLALLFMVAGAVLAAVALFGLASGRWGPTIALGVIMTLAVALTIVVWVRHGRAFAAGATLIRLPLYVLWKIPVYLKLVKGGEQQWVRTRRPGEGG